MNLRDDPAGLRVWLDRPAPRPYAWLFDGEMEPTRGGWRDWYDGDTYLGLWSARTGPDAVVSAQRCGCEQCTGGNNVRET